MTTTAQSVIRAVQVDILVDPLGVRWPASELVRDLNDMQRAVALVRPDATAASWTHTLVAGTLQTLPATDALLIEFTNLTAGAKSSVRQTKRELLDAIEPDWRSQTQTATIKHYIYDPRHPRRFEVYPPAIAGTQLDGIVSRYPTDVAAPASPGLLYTTVTGDISLADEFKNALIHLVAYRAYMKAAEFANEPEIATAHLQFALREVGEGLLAQLNAKPSLKNDASAAEPSA
jgi:hypothetical protein